MDALRPCQQQCNGAGLQPSDWTASPTNQRALCLFSKQRSKPTETTMAPSLSSWLKGPLNQQSLCNLLYSSMHT
ncbi:hypothetical protein VZT92_015663 [Zoarces viviparus]|uniref:Uncharacterized protein n=1 Tax=Zoarces viviparus TaxID=48416 RepID=A0AAW1EXJ3_ZOAVI